MAKHPDPRITPYLLYSNAGAAIEWLGGAYGLKPYGEVFMGEQGEVTHAAMRLGKSVIMLGGPGPTYKNPRALGSVTQYLYVRVKKIDKHFARAKKAGAHIIEELTDKPYGHRRYGSADPEGHVWYFAQPIKPPKAKKGNGEKKKASKGRKPSRKKSKRASASGTSGASSATKRRRKKAPASKRGRRSAT